MKTPVSRVGNKTSILHILYAVFPQKYERLWTCSAVRGAYYSVARIRAISRCITILTETLSTCSDA